MSVHLKALVAFTSKPLSIRTRKWLSVNSIPPAPLSQQRTYSTTKSYPSSSTISYRCYAYSLIEAPNIAVNLNIMIISCTWLSTTSIILRLKLGIRKPMEYVKGFTKQFSTSFYQVTFRKNLYKSMDQLQRDLDAWVDDYIARNGRPAQKGLSTCDAKRFQASRGEVKSGISTSASAGGEFAKALERLNSTKPKKS